MASHGIFSHLLASSPSCGAKSGVARSQLPLRRLQKRFTVEADEIAIGSRSEWRPDDIVGRAVHVGKIVTGRIEDTRGARPKKVADKE